MRVALQQTHELKPMTFSTKLRRLEIDLQQKKPPPKRNFETTNQTPIFNSPGRPPGSKSRATKKGKEERTFATNVPSGGRKMTYVTMARGSQHMVTNVHEEPAASNFRAENERHMKPQTT